MRFHVIDQTIHQILCPVVGLGPSLRYGIHNFTAKTEHSAVLCVDDGVANLEGGTPGKLKVSWDRTFNRRPVQYAEVATAIGECSAVLFATEPKERTDRHQCHTAKDTQTIATG